LTPQIYSLAGHGFKPLIYFKTKAWSGWLVWVSTTGIGIYLKSRFGVGGTEGF